MKVFPAAILATALAAMAACPAEAAGLARTTLGCRTPGDLARAQAPKGGTLDAASRALVASGACTLLAKGVVVDVDEEKAPLTCVRLAGDLSCLWVQGAVIDQHPGEKGSGGGRHGGRTLARELGVDGLTWRAPRGGIVVDTV